MLPSSFGSLRMRAQYSMHVLRAHVGGFSPVSLRQFIELVAPIEFAVIGG